LGLAIVRQAVDAHGGRIDVKDDPGRGCTFTVVLPASPPSPPPVRHRS
jgi:signal transduction histidine kinase